MTVAQLEKEMLKMGQTVSTLSEQLKGALRRIEEQTRLADSVQKLVLNVSEQTAELKHIRKDIDAVRTDVDDLRFKPGRRWEMVICQVVGLIVATMVGLLVGKLGLS